MTAGAVAPRHDTEVIKEGLNNISMRCEKKIWASQKVVLDAWSQSKLFHSMTTRGKESMI